MAGLGKGFFRWFVLQDRELLGQERKLAIQRVVLAGLAPNPPEKV